MLKDVLNTTHSTWTNSLISLLRSAIRFVAIIMDFSSLLTSSQFGLINSKIRWGQKSRHDWEILQVEYLTG
jgi:hypothetical protein